MATTKLSWEAEAALKLRLRLLPILMHLLSPFIQEGNQKIHGVQSPPQPPRPRGNFSYAPLDMEDCSNFAVVEPKVLQVCLLAACQNHRPLASAEAAAAAAAVLPLEREEKEEGEEHYEAYRALFKQAKMTLSFTLLQLLLSLLDIFKPLMHRLHELISMPFQHQANFHARTQSSPSSLVDYSGRISPRYETPPGTPPPPYQGADDSRALVSNCLLLIKPLMHSVRYFPPFLLII